MGFTLQQRQNAERQIVKATVDALLAAGFALSVYNGEEMLPTIPSTNKERIVKELFQCDEELLVVWKPGKRFGWIQFVYGNDGFDVLADFTVNLEEWIDGGTQVGAIVRKFELAWELTL